VYTVVYGRAASWTSPYTPSHRLHITAIWRLQGCAPRGAVTSTREMNCRPLPANLTHCPGLKPCASGDAQAHLIAQSSVTWRADLATISCVPDADNTGIDDCEEVAARDYWREITLVWVFLAAFPHIPLDE
jgi:hypothetical protein